MNLDLIEKNHEIILASLECNADKIRMLLSLGADHSCFSSLGWTPLMCVAMKCRVGIDPVMSAHVLVAAGADINIISANGDNALSFAAEGPCLELVKYFLEQGASLQQLKTAENPLENAASTSVQRILLEYGADPDHVGISGQSARERLSLAYQDHESEGNFDIAEKLKAMIKVLDSYRRVKN